MRVAAGVGDGNATVGVDRGIRVEVGVGDGFKVAATAVVVAVVVGDCGEGAHAANRIMHRLKAMLNRKLFMPSVYNGFASVFRRLPDA